MSEATGDTLDKTASETGVPVLDRLARFLALLGGALAVGLVSQVLDLESFQSGVDRALHAMDSIACRVIRFLFPLRAARYRCNDATTTMNITTTRPEREIP